jgi:hypothetical protein
VIDNQDVDPVLAAFELETHLLLQGPARKFHTRVITDGVVPSLHVDYKNSRIKQYHEEGRALRTETTINNTRDVGIGKLLKNLPELRRVGFQANRRLLDVQTVYHDCAIGEDAFEKVVRPIQVEGQRASALRFGDAHVQALLSVLALFSFQLRGFTNQEMRALLAQLLGLDPAHCPVGRMTYDLRRLRLHGLSASRKAIATTSPRRACAFLCSSRVPMRAYCVQNSHRLCPAVHQETPLCGPPLIAFRLRLTAAATRRNSSPENLTHLHYNFLDKDSSRANAHAASRSRTF